MSARTLFLSRLLGLFYLICGLAMIVHKHAYLDAVSKLTSNPTALFLVSLLIVIAGLAMILAHNVWSKSAPAVMVSLVGWLTLLKGVVYLLLPAKWMQAFFQAAFNSDVYFYSAAGFLLLLGAYLAYEGFRPQSA